MSLCLSTLYGQGGGVLAEQMYVLSIPMVVSRRPTCFKAGGEVCDVVMNKEKIRHSGYCGDVAPALLVLGEKIIVQCKDNSSDANGVRAGKMR
jgi:hypothetical protein